MLDAPQCVKGIQEDLVAGLASTAGDEANPARGVLDSGSFVHPMSFGIGGRVPERCRRRDPKNRL
jgi:hypothetical protein